MDEQNPGRVVPVEETPPDQTGGEVGEVKAANERIGVGSGDEQVAKIQLAARWAEAFAPQQDTMEAALQRFYRAYAYVDSVTHSVTPEGP